MFIMH